MLRSHYITGEPIIHAPARAERPDTYARLRIEGWAAPPFDASCPFCPGNEEETPPEVSRLGEPWRIRVFPNKYPFAMHHEVVVESPAHDARFSTIPWPADVVATFAARHAELSARPGVRQVVIFKNHGPMAGASLRHVHSQIAALDFLPPRIERELTAFEMRPCPLCRPLAPTVGETATFLAIAPPATPFGGQLLLAPRRHTPSLRAFTPAEISDLAALLQMATAAAERTSASHNWLLLDFPASSAGHFYAEVFPRTSPVAGFELATGTHVDQGGARDESPVPDRPDDSTRQGGK